MEVSPCRSNHCQTFIGCGVPQTWLILPLEGIVQVVEGLYSVFQQQWAPPPYVTWKYDAVLPTESHIFCAPANISRQSWLPSTHNSRPPQAFAQCPIFRG